MSKKMKLIFLWLALFVVLCIMYDIGKSTSDFSSKRAVASSCSSGLWFPTIHSCYFDNK